MSTYNRSTREYRQHQAISLEELLSRESMCVQEQPPYCLAECPLSLDGRALCAAVAEGDLSRGRGLIEAITPFAHLLSSCCDERCAKKCKVGELGDPVSLRAIEQACLEHAEAPRQRRLPTRSRGKSVGVFGGDLFAAALAWELAKKAYDVTLFCAGEDLLSSLSGSLPNVRCEIIEKDIPAATSYSYQAAFSADITAEYIQQKRADFDVICVSSDVLALLDKSAAPNPLTLRCEGLDLFAGSGDAAVVMALADAKRAAASVDRFTQGVPVERDRAEEGSYPTKLFTSLEGVEPSKTLYRGAPLTKDEAIAEAKRCIHCECLECVKGCEFLRSFKRYPKQTLREIYNNLAIIMGDHTSNKLINSCALCGQCKAVCPNDFDLPEVCRIARETMVITGKMPPSTHEFAILDMEFSNSAEYFTAKLPEGKSECEYAFFPGCQMGAVLPETTAAAYADLNERLGGVGLLLGCCGAIAKWSGRGEALDECLLQLKSAYEAMGSPKLITACPTCAATLKEYVTENVVGVWDILLDIGLPNDAKSAQKLFVHDACGARGDEATQNSIRALAASLGCETVDSAFSRDKTACCGYGGLTSYANRELARDMSDFCLTQGSGDCLTYCPNCRDLFTKRGATASHILELVYGAEGSGSPTLSERRANRKRLRAELLKEYWGEDTVEKTHDFKVEFPEEVIASMEERMVLESDIYETLAEARASKGAIKNTETNELITTHRIGNVQFWVRYKETGDGCLVTGVYSHRMTIREL